LDDEKESVVKVNDVSNEPTSVLRNRLFPDKEKITDGSTEHVLQHHRMMQDELSDSLLNMAQGLKQRSLAFSEALRDDSQVYSTSSYY
jgi:Membrane fusion protein Use1